MGVIAKIIEINGRKIKIDLGGGNIVTADLVLPPGEDSKPLKTDYSVAIAGTKTGSVLVIGFADLQNADLSEDGEKRIYSREQSSGNVVAEIFLKNDGSIELKNDSGEIKLLANGTIDLNGATIDSSGNMTVSTLTIGSISFSSHVHTDVTTGGDVTGGPQ